MSMPSLLIVLHSEVHMYKSWMKLLASKAMVLVMLMLEWKVVVAATVAYLAVRQLMKRSLRLT